jgi:hypothetical protein
MSFSNIKQATQLSDELLLRQSQQLLTQEKGFNYAVLTPEVQIIVQEKTSELKSLMRRSAQDIIDMGATLLEIRCIIKE